MSRNKKRIETVEQSTQTVAESIVLAPAQEIPTEVSTEVSTEVTKHVEPEIVHEEQSVLIWTGDKIEGIEYRNLAGIEETLIDEDCPPEQHDQLIELFHKLDAGMKEMSIGTQMIGNGSFSVGEVVDQLGRGLYQYVWYKKENRCCENLKEACEVVLPPSFKYARALQTRRGMLHARMIAKHFDKRPFSLPHYLHELHSRYAISYIQNTVETLVKENVTGLDNLRKDCLASDVAIECEIAAWNMATQALPAPKDGEEQTARRVPTADDLVIYSVPAIVQVFAEHVNPSLQRVAKSPTEIAKAQPKYPVSVIRTLDKRAIEARSKTLLEDGTAKDEKEARKLAAKEAKEQKDREERAAEEATQTEQVQAAKRAAPPLPIVALCTLDHTLHKLVSFNERLAEQQNKPCLEDVVFDAISAENIRTLMAHLGDLLLNVRDMENAMTHHGGTNVKAARAMALPTAHGSHDPREEDEEEDEEE